MGSQMNGSTAISDMSLECVFCGATRPADLRPLCTNCGGTLKLNRPDAPDLGENAVTLGEGDTPLLPLRRLFPDLDVHGKAEWLNPTGSFKDRGAALAVSIACAMGAKGIVCASTGNNAGAVSAYAARAGLPCIVVLPLGTAAGKLLQVRTHGAFLVQVEGSFSDAQQVAVRVNRSNPAWANLTSTFINPYMTSAYDRIAKEIVDHMGQAPGSVFVPIGAGPMLEGVYEGFSGMLSEGKISKMPAMVGVQAQGCAPIARAFAEDRQEVEEWSEPARTIAGSINDPLRGYASDGTRTLRRIRATGGLAWAVSDEAILSAIKELGRVEGIGCEPGSASTVAALRELESKKSLLPPGPYVLILTAHILKDAGGMTETGYDRALTIDVDPSDRDLAGMLETVSNAFRH